jgi:hypothetical protein
LHLSEDSSGQDQRGRYFLQAIYNVRPAVGERVLSLGLFLAVTTWYVTGQSPKFFKENRILATVKSEKPYCTTKILA